MDSFHVTYDELIKYYNAHSIFAVKIIEVLDIMKHNYCFNERSSFSDFDVINLR